MTKRLFIFDWDQTSAEAHSKALRAQGWEVDLEWQDGGRGSKAVKQAGPDAVIFYLEHKPSHSRATAQYLAETKATSSIPLVFVGGSDETLENTRSTFPNARFVGETELTSAIKELFKAKP